MRSRIWSANILMGCYAVKLQQEIFGAPVSWNLFETICLLVTVSSYLQHNCVVETDCSSGGPRQLMTTSFPLKVFFNLCFKSIFNRQRQVFSPLFTPSRCNWFIVVPVGFCPLWKRTKTSCGGTNTPLWHPNSPLWHHNLFGSQTVWFSTRHLKNGVTCFPLVRKHLAEWVLHELPPKSQHVVFA